MNWKNILSILLLLLLIGQILSLFNLNWGSDSSDYAQGKLIGKAIIIGAICTILYILQRKKGAS